MSRSYDIFRIAADYPVGGKPSYGLQPNFYYLSKEQVRIGNRVKIIARRIGSEPSLENDGNVEIHRLENPFNVNAYRLITRMKENNGRSLIHTHSTSGFFLSMAKSPLGLPVFSHVHGASRSKRMPQKLKGVEDQDFSSSKMWYYYFRERLFWSLANRVLAVSTCLKQDLIDYYNLNGSRIDVVYNGVDTRLFHRVSSEVPEPLKKFEGKKIVLYVGHFGPRKGLIFLIRALPEIALTVPDAVVVAVGGVPAWLGKNKYWAYLKNEIAKRGMEEKIFLLDRVPNEMLPAYYSNANVFVLPSFYEAFAKVVLEAMACECPVVITREGGPQEAIDEGKSGFLIDYASESQLATAVSSILRDEGKAREMGVKARERILKDFTWEAVARRVNLAYGEILP